MSSLIVDKYVSYRILLPPDPELGGNRELVLSNISKKEAEVIAAALEQYARKVRRQIGQDLR